MEQYYVDAMYLCERKELGAFSPMTHLVEEEKDVSKEWSLLPSLGDSSELLSGFCKQSVMLVGPVSALRVCVIAVAACKRCCVGDRYVAEFRRKLRNYGVVSN